jgi:DNA-binding NtrC family response regulator
MPKILVVDDKEMMRDSLHATLNRVGYEVQTAESATDALVQIKQCTFDVILTDLKMPKMNGLEFIDELKRIEIDAQVVMMTAFASIDTAVEAMRKGAYDYIQKPFDADEIVLLLQRVLDHRQLQKENEAYQVNAKDWQRGCELVGSSEAMAVVMERIRLVARSSATVFIQGESGTGKELIARAIHAQSPRANKPFLCVNCAALSSTLLESELFGHEKGAFTGADQMRKGRFELADGGTLLLDEISEMDMHLQAKLLRVLQEREFERVGSSLTRQVNVRIITTTNRPLESWVQEGKFREDLYYRLNVVPVHVPPLRERSEDDIESLCEYFLRRITEREGMGLKMLSRSALEGLKRYSWPGNVRELENIMERLSILTVGENISAETVQNLVDMDINLDPVSSSVNKCVKIAEMERNLIEKTLKKFDGHRQKTATALGIGVRTLGMKLKRWRTEQSATV